MLPYLPHPPPRLILFGGKGGVGKSTVAAATAVFLATRDPTLRVTVASSDPAHSLGDVLAAEVGSVPTPVPGLPNLAAVHIDAAARWREFIQRRRAGLSELLSDGLELDAPEIERILGFSVPGLDEIVALLEVERITKSGSADVLVVDTAPTGHTIRLLELPDTLPAWLGFVDGLRDKQRYIAARFGGAREGEADRFVRALREDLKRIRDLLRDRARCRFVPVMGPEPVVVEETERLVERLGRLRIPVTHVVVNRYRGAESARWIEAMRSRFPALEFVRCARRPGEIIGKDDLLRFAEGAGAESGGGLPGSGAAKVPPLSRLGALGRSVRIVLVAGKGGVGKSTVAAALALTLARRLSKAEKLLLYSTDPAHSLADVLGVPIGHEAAEVSGSRGLWARQADPFRTLEDLKRVPREEVDKLFDGLAEDEHVDLPFERRALRSIFDLVPPGLDEAMSMADLCGHLTGNEYRLFVVDSAPTGHFLRLLETPDLACRWLGVLMELLVKRGLAAKLAGTLDEVAGLTVRLRMLKDVLASSEACHAVVVTTPERVVLAETDRLVGTLKSRGISVRGVVLNMVAGSDAVASARRLCPGLFQGAELLVVPRLAEEPRGSDRLGALLRD